MFFNVTSTITNGENASDEVGEVSQSGSPVYTANGPNNRPSAQGLNTAYGDAIDTVGHRLFAVDQSNNRILVFPLDANNNIATTTAAYVLGQSRNFASSTATTTQSGLTVPKGCL